MSKHLMMILVAAGLSSAALADAPRALFVKDGANPLIAASAMLQAEGLKLVEGENVNFEICTICPTQEQVTISTGARSPMTATVSKVGGGWMMWPSSKTSEPAACEKVVVATSLDGYKNLVR